MYVKPNQIAEIADNMQPLFESGPLHSRSRIGEIARHAAEELADAGLPTRRSLCFVVAKVALATWQETITQARVTLS